MRLKHDKPLSSFGFNLNLRRYIVGAVFGVQGGPSCEPRMVICYMPKTTFDITYPSYASGVRPTASDIFAGNACSVVYNGTKSPMYPYTSGNVDASISDHQYVTWSEAGAYTRPFLSST